MASPNVVSHIHQLLDEHWTATLHVEQSVWRDAEVVVASHPEPSHADHVYLIRRQESCIIVVPESLVGATTTAVASWPSAAVFDRAFLRSLYGDAVASIHGPFWLGYATAESIRLVDGRGARPLEGADDERALASLRELLSENEWVDSGFEIENRLVYGCFVDSQLVAAGTLTPFRGVPANIGAVVHPENRNQGFGSALLSALTKVALSQSDAVQCRILEDNRPAVRIARLLGYVEDGHTLEVVLRTNA